MRVLALIKMGRPFILPGGILAYGLGTAMGQAHRAGMDWRRAGLGLLITVLANLSAHYADEYADVDTDTLTQRTWFSGGSGVLPAGLVPPVWALRMAWMLVMLAVLLTVGSIAAGWLTWHVAWIVGIGLLGGWFYAMPPVALERRGLGELDNAFLGGIMMPLMGYTVQTGAPSWTALVALIPIVPMVMAGLLAVHWADRLADAMVGRRSLTMILGDRVRPLHYALVAFSYASALAFGGRVLPYQASAAIGLTLPLSLWAMAAFTRQSSPVPSSLAMAAMILAAAVGWGVS